MHRPSRRPRSDTREPATAASSASGLPLRAPARPYPVSGHSACPRQAWAPDRLTPPLTPAGIAVAWPQQRADLLSRVSRPMRAHVSPVATVARWPVRAERLAAVWPPRPVAVPAAGRPAVRAVHPFPAVRAFRVPWVAVPPPRVGCPALQHRPRKIPGRRNPRAPGRPFADRTFRARHPPWRRVRRAVDAGSEALPGSA